MDEPDYLQERKAAGLTQAELARRTGYSRTHVSRAEQGLTGVSPRYAEVFRLAVKRDATASPNKGLTHYPALHARKLVSDSGRTIETAIGDLEQRLRSLSKAKEALDRIQELVTLLCSEAPDFDSASFSPTTATDEEFEAVSKFIVGVIAEMMIDHRFHMLTEEQINACLALWIKQVSIEVRKAKNRSALAGLGS